MTHPFCGLPGKISPRLGTKSALELAICRPGACAMASAIPSRRSVTALKSFGRNRRNSQAAFPRQSAAIWTAAAILMAAASDNYFIP
jgi:hypothetical protein